MRAAFCENCGSTNLVEHKGLIICKHCGMRMHIARNGKTTYYMPTNNRSTGSGGKASRSKAWIWVVIILLLLALGAGALLVYPGMDRIFPPAPDASTEQLTPVPTDAPTAAPTATPTSTEPWS